MSERHDAWRLAPDGYDGPHLRDVMIALEISGNARDGFHLVMTPDGCFTADYGYATEAEARRAAEEIFGASPTAWKR